MNRVAGTVCVNSYAVSPPIVAVPAYRAGTVRRSVVLNTWYVTRRVPDGHIAPRPDMRTRVSGPTAAPQQLTSSPVVRWNAIRHVEYW